MADGRYVIWGSAGHAKVLADAIAEAGDGVAAVFDNNPAAEKALVGVDLFIGKAGFDAWAATVDPGAYRGLVAIGGPHGRARVEMLALLRAAGVQLPPLVHGRAYVAPTARLGDGCQALANTTIAADARLGEACIVNHGAGVDHECRLGDGVHIAPGAVLCGCVDVGAAAFVGAGAVVLPRLSIGPDAVVGAGAVVVKDVPAGAVVAGNPARPLRPGSSG